MTYTLEQLSEFKTAFFAAVETASHVVITAHYSPDDDSIASVLSVYTMLVAKYNDKDIQVIYTGPVADRYTVLPHFDRIRFVDDIANYLPGTDLLIILDVNHIARISKLPEKITAMNIPVTICIDHHATAPDHFSHSLIVPSVTSNSELIYRALCDDSMLTKELASLFLMGILGDTGNFAYVPPAQSDVFVLAKKLIDVAGVSIDAFRSAYSGIPKEIMPLLQALVTNTTYEKVIGWPDVQYSYLDRTVVEAGKFTDEDISAASHIYMGQYLTRVKGQSWGFVLTPRVDGSARISGRSLPGSVNIRDMFERMKVGGGHDRASGGSFLPTQGPVDPKQAALAVCTWMSHNHPLIS